MPTYTQLRGSNHLEETIRFQFSNGWLRLLDTKYLHRILQLTKYLHMYIGPTKCYDVDILDSNSQIKNFSQVLRVNGQCLDQHPEPLILVPRLHHLHHGYLIRKEVEEPETNKIQSMMRCRPRVILWLKKQARDSMKTLAA